jgi:TetR/AcrR family acrAB operon transcriptional repressor
VRRTQAERSKESRRRLLDAAFDLLVERCSLQFTLSDVGERAGYSRGLPGQVFGSKDGLMIELVQHLNTVTREMPLLDIRDDGFRAVLATVAGMMAAPETQRKISLSLQILLGEAAQPGSPIHEPVAGLSRMASGYISKQLRLAVARGEVRPDINPRAQGILIISAIHGALRQWLVDPERISTEDLRREILMGLIRGMAVQPDLWLAEWLPPRTRSDD